MGDLQFDVVIAGTGIVATVVGATMARNGRKVLQIDRHNCYGQMHRTMSIKNLLHEGCCLNRKDVLQGQYESYIAQLQSSMCDEGSSVVQSSVVGGQQGKDGAMLTPLTGMMMMMTTTESSKIKHKIQRLRDLMTILLDGNTSDSTVCFEVMPFVKGEGGGGIHEIMALEQLCESSSKYAIDLWPKLLFSRSAAVDLLVSSGAHSYTHFTDTKGPMLYGYEPSVEGELLTLYEVPNNKNAICRSQLLSPLEKRTLMLLISSLSDLMFIPKFSSLSLRGGDAPDNSANANILDAVDEPEENWLHFLRSGGCTQNMVDLLSYGICLGGGDVVGWSKRHGLERMLKYIQSIGVCGENEAPFVYPMYGTGDIVQAFCRVGAVLGATFMLGTTITSIGMDSDERVNSIQLSNGINVQTRLLMVDDDKTVPEGMRKCCPQSDIAASDAPRHLHVLMVILPQPLLPGLNIAVINPKPASDQDDGKREPIYLLQTGSNEGTAPDNMYVIYYITVDKTAPAKFTSFAECQHQTVCRLLRCFNTMVLQKGYRLEQTVMALYTSHLVDDHACHSGNMVENYRGWLSEVHPNRGSGVLYLPKVKATPVMPLIEELPLAVHVCDTLLGNPPRNLTAYMDVGLEGFLDVNRKEDPHDAPMDSTAEKLQHIINKYG